MEEITLGVPIAPVATARFRPVRLVLDLDEEVIEVVLRGPTGLTRARTWTGADALAKMTALNKANLTVKSLWWRILEQVQAEDPTLAGAIADNP